MTNLKEQTLHDVELLPGVHREVDPYNKSRAIFWQQQVGQNAWQRISNDQQAEVVSDGDA